jgi:hypothetical protein
MPRGESKEWEESKQRGESKKSSLEDELIGMKLEEDSKESGEFLNTK